MLVENPSDTIVCLKTVSGEEVIGQLVDKTPSTYTIKSPLVLAMTQKGPVMIPYMTTMPLETDLPMNANLVMIIKTAPEDVISAYKATITQMTTGIQTVQRPGIITP